MAEKIKKTKLSERYMLTRGTFNLDVEVRRDSKNKKRLHILGQHGKDFVFYGSKPETVKAMAELLLEASKL